MEAAREQQLITIQEQENQIKDLEEAKLNLESMHFFHFILLAIPILPVKGFCTVFI